MNSMDSVLPVILVFRSQMKEDVLKLRLKKVIQTVKHSILMGFVLNVPKDPSSILLEYVSLLILHASLMIKLMVFVPHVMQDMNFLQTDNASQLNK